MNETQRYHHIEKYLNGELSEQEQIDFDHKITQDEALQKELALHKTFFDVKLLRSEKASQFFNMLESVHQEELAKEKEKPALEGKHSTDPSMGRRVMLKRVLAVAASLLLPVLCYLLFFQTNKYESLFEAYAIHEKLESERSNNPDQIYRKLKTTFHNENYTAVLPLCDAYLEKGTAQNFYYEVYLAKGISLLETGQLNAALENFSAYAQFTVDDKVKGSWYKALTYLKMKDPENCKAALKKVIETDRYKASDAKELLRKLN